MATVNMCEDISQGVEACPIPCPVPWNRLQQAFKYVKTNVPGQGVNRNKFTEQFSGCGCRGPCTIETCLCLQLFGDAYDDSGKLKNNGLNNLSSKPILECGHACSCDPVCCANRVVQQGIKTKLSIFQSKNKGYGLMLDSKSESTVPRLSFVCEYAGEVVGRKEAIKRIQETDAAQQDNYLIAVKEYVSGAETCTYVDPRRIGNIGRFINHSCDPNLLMLPVRVNHQVPRLALFARRDIHPGEELTFDYSGCATFNNSLDRITVRLSVRSPVTIAPPTAATENSTIFQCNTLVEELTQLPKAAADTNPRIKRIKLDQISSSNNVTPLMSRIESESNFSLKNDINDCRQGSEVTRELEMLNPKSAANGGISEADVDKPTFSVTSVAVKRKLCFCGSFNCIGFLPLDSNLVSN